MRENKRDRKNVKSGLMHVYKVQGLNLDRFLNSVKNRGIALNNVKKTTNKELFVSVYAFDSKKFFAIAKELCYNVIKVSERGKALPFVKLYRSLGLVLGAILFIVSTCVLNDFVYGFSFSGTGSVYQKEVLAYLNGVGIKKFSRFSNIDLERLEDGILSSNSHLSFVSAEKQGNTLKIDLAIATDNVDRLNGNVEFLYSEVSGVVEKIVVYRGTAMVAVGDYVEKGALLVDGNMTIKEQVVKTGVIANVSLIVEDTIDYTDTKEGQEQKATLLALAKFDEKEVVDVSVETLKEQDLWVYKAHVKYRYVLYAG